MSPSDTSVDAHSVGSVCCLWKFLGFPLGLMTPEGGEKKGAQQRRNVPRVAMLGQLTGV